MEEAVVAPVSGRAETGRKRWNRGRAVLVMMALPFVLMVFIFNYIPLFGWVYAFFDYRPGVPLADSPYTGLKYFRIALGGGSELGNVLLNTFAISFLTLLASPLPVALAILLSEAKSGKFRKVVQTITTLPNFISWIIVFSLFYAIFSIEGLVNQLLDHWQLSGEPINPLANSQAAWYIQTGISVWKTVGFSAIVYMAAIAGIDQEQYDAAKVDGAGRFKAIIHVTIPNILPTYLVLLLLAVSNMLSNGFDQYYVFMNPVVADKLEVLDYYLFRVGIAQSDYSLSTALGIFKTLVSVTMLFAVNAAARKLRGESII